LGVIVVLRELSFELYAVTGVLNLTLYNGVGPPCVSGLWFRPVDWEMPDIFGEDWDEWGEGAGG
jgi:hypothetical protein